MADIGGVNGVGQPY